VNKTTSTDPQPPDNNNLHALNERTKELKCLYGVFKLLNMTDVPLDKTLQAVADLVPNAWQYPEKTCARLILGDKEYRSERYASSDAALTARIAVNNENLGMVEVAYEGGQPDNQTDPFLEEEVYLLEAVASLVGQTLRRKALEDEKIQLYKDLQKNYEKVLSGFIPICASCKSIRDGDGAWHQIETYVQKRTEAKFSHGICPVCIKKLYPHFKES